MWNNTSIEHDVSIKVSSLMVFFFFYFSISSRLEARDTRHKNKDFECELRAKAKAVLSCIFNLHSTSYVLRILYADICHQISIWSLMEMNFDERLLLLYYLLFFSFFCINSNIHCFFPFAFCVKFCVWMQSKTNFFQTFCHPETDTIIIVSINRDFYFFLNTKINIIYYCLLPKLSFWHLSWSTTHSQPNPQYYCIWEIIGSWVARQIYILYTRK